MHVSPQRRTILQHQNLQKWSKHVMFCVFSLPKVPFATGACIFFNIRTYKSGPDTSCFVHFHFRIYLFATGACIFSTSELTKVVQALHVLYIFTSKCAFRHSGVQFLISPLSSDLRTRRFNRPTFRLTRHTNHWKNTAFRDVSNIWHGCIFFPLTFALLHLFTSDLTALLGCLSTLHIVGSLLFKLPSITFYVHPKLPKCRCLYIKLYYRHHTSSLWDHFVIGQSTVPPQLLEVLPRCNVVFSKPWRLHGWPWRCGAIGKDTGVKDD